MTTRRAFMAAEVGLLAVQTVRRLAGQTLRTPALENEQPPGVTIQWTDARAVPEEFARQSMVFMRAYSSCPRRGPSRRAAETGRFPHAAGAGDPTFAGFLKDAAAMNGITVFAAECGDDEESPFEHSVHVPFALRWPGVLKPGVDDQTLVSLVDLAPTLLGLAGIDASPQMQGRDLSALLLPSRVEKKAESPDSVLAEGKLGQPDEWRMVVRGFDKIVVNREGEATHLFNLADDPEEAVNLVRSGDHVLTRDSMLALVRTWRRKLADGVDPSGLRLR